MTATAPLRLVVGSGYLGGRVGRLWADRGDRVIGTTRSTARGASLAAAGIEPRSLDVTTADWEPLFAECGLPATIFWSVGFDRTAGGSSRDVHVIGLARMLDAVATASASGDQSRPRIIFSSSTGVWGDEAGGIVDETTPVSPAREAGRTLVEAEALLATHPAGPGVALRFAGLYGPDRLPRLDDLRAGRPIPADPDSWLNLIHVDDAARVVVAVADAATPDSLYVVSDGQPVRRRDWYGRLAAETGSPPPTWDPSAARTRGGDKRVNPARLLAAGLLFQLERPAGHPIERSAGHPWPR
jgi:nucleoside-diphosphate-sugar epimerase